MIRARPGAAGFVRRLSALVLREMSSRYGGTAGGYVWAVLEPVGAIALLAVAFALVVRTPPLGSSFLLFYAVGYLPFYTFQKVSHVVMMALSYTRNLMRYPALSWFEAVLARALLQALTCWFVAYLILWVVVWIADDRVVVQPVNLILGFALATGLAVGAGVCNCALAGIWPAWGQIWGIVSKPLFLASGVIWVFADLPRAARDVLWYNPLVHVGIVTRQGIYPMYSERDLSLLYAAGVGLVLTALGLALMHLCHRSILQRL